VEVLEESAKSRPRAVAQSIAAGTACNRLFAEAAKRYGAPSLRGLVVVPNEIVLPLAPPYILGFAHIGVYEALAPVFERLEGPTLLWREGEIHLPTHRLAIATTEGGIGRRAAAFVKAVKWLRDGGIVATALDVLGEPGIPIRLLDRRLELARGPFALARRMGVPIVPAVAIQRKGCVTVISGPPLEAVASHDKAVESQLAQSTMDWFGAFLRHHPDDMGLGLLRALVAAPLWSSAVTDASKTAPEA
jgi:hypothetical protein